MIEYDGQKTAGRRKRQSDSALGLPTWGPASVWFRVVNLGAALKDVVRTESERGRVALWLPCALLLGVAIYFVLPSEPWLPILAMSTALSGALAFVRAGRGHSPVLLTVLALIFAGMTAAKYESDRALSPRLSRAMTAKVTGLVNYVEPAKRKRLRLTIAPDSIEGVAKPEMPRIVRVSTHDRNQGFRPGERVVFLARLAPPSGPVLPGGFDFSFSAYFEGRGAGGYVIGKVERLKTETAERTVWRATADRIAGIRAAIGTHISSRLPDASGTIARALIVGERQAIPAGVVDDLREAGLAHILAISGLHMMLLTGTAFWVARALFALSPTLALNYPIKKWAGGIAFAVGFQYLLLSGASVATERAFIMVGVALIAILIDRPAITLRSLAVAAIIVGIAFPHSVMGPSFQMSFLAVAALIGFAEWTTARPNKQNNRHSGWRAKSYSKLKFYFLGLAGTSLLAGAATAPLAAYHFNAVAPLSLLGNLAAMPVVGLVVMPVGFLACLLIPFGLDHLAFQIMGFGIDLVVTIADFVSGLSDGAEYVGMISPLTPVLCALGILWTAIWQTRWRWAGIGLFVAGASVAPVTTPPHIVINADGTAVLIRSGQDPVAIMRRRGSAFESRIWLRAFADERGTRDKTLQEGVVCDQVSCVFRYSRNKKTGEPKPDNEPPKARQAYMNIALTLTKTAFTEDCQNADILVSPFDAPSYCPKPSHIFDRRHLAQTGAISIRLKDGHLESVTASRPRHPRPWHTPNLYISGKETDS